MKSRIITFGIEILGVVVILFCLLLSLPFSALGALANIAFNGFKNGWDFIDNLGS
jgi:hypothetical protein